MKLFISLLILAFFILFGFSRCQKQVFEAVTDTVITGSCEHPGHRSTTITLQPGPAGGMDCLVASLPIYAPFNLTGNPDIVASQWTYEAQGYGEGTVRGYIEFIGLDSIPSTGVTIDSAKLSLYGLDPYTGTASPEGNSYYPGSPYNSYGDNPCWLKRVRASWSQDSINWFNMPPTTDSNETAVPASISQWNNNVTVDVTKLVQDVVNSKQNFGFCLIQQTEQIYRSLNFAGSRNPDPSKWPKLMISYTLH